MRKLLLLLAASVLATPAPGPRELEVTETVQIEVPKGARRLRVWIPKAPSGPGQRAELLAVEAPVAHRLTADPDFGNELIFLDLKSPAPGGLALKTRYRVTRGEQMASAEDKVSRLETRPRGLVVVTDEVRRIAARETAGLSDPYRKGRALYDYVLKSMAYDKSGAGWGRGDVVYACKVGKGNCTDFHSLFIALCLAEGIPARFKMGFSLPAAPKGDVGPGYHCWAEFHAGARGWVPVDISEAWKNPAKRDFFFGRLDAHRVALSTGREIRLTPRQKGAPLNFMARPYAEADGKPVKDLVVERAYADVAEKGG